MSNQDTQPAGDRAEAGPRRWAVRSREDRLVAGLAAGLADHWGVPAAYIRAAFVVAALAAGAGIVLYVLGWAATLDRDEDAPVSPAKTANQKAGLVLIYVGGLAALRGFELWLGDEIVFSVALLAFGTAAMWDRSDATARSRIVKLTGSNDPELTRIRVIGGGLLMLAGLSVFVGSIDALAGVGPVLLAVALTVAGFMILFGPLVWRMGRELADERRGRIRADERSEMAAHLHDSVLQTLALIQRSDDPKRMVTLARGQERELRDWLYGSDRERGQVDLGAAVRDQAARVEQGHNIPVDVVVVGDAALDESMSALAQAAGEAMNNAAKHSGAGKVSVYVEVGDDSAEVYVADDGKGFDPDAVGDEGQGIAESIVGRMQRHGGEATIVAAPGEGTEVRLRMPRE